MSDNKVLFGLKDVRIAFRKAIETTPPEWDPPIAIPGVIGYKPSPEGEESSFYADDGLYYWGTTNNGYTGDLEMALIPDEVKKEMFGWEFDTNGTLVEISDGVPKEFAFMGQIQGDKKNRKFIYYSCKAGRPTREEKTRGDKAPAPATETMKITTTPIEVDGKKIVKGTIELSDTNATAYNAFFDAVTKPAFGTGV